MAKTETNTIIVRSEDIPRRRADTYRDVYANSCNIRVGPFDVIIIFTHNKEINGEMVGEDQFSVTLSPQQFKALANVLTSTLTAYEQVFGEQRLPPGITPKADFAETLANAVSAISAPASTEKKPPSSRSRGARKEKAS